MISPKALNLDASGDIVPAGDPRGVEIFCGAGSTLEGDRAAKLQAHYDKVKAEADAVAAQDAADKAAAEARTKAAETKAAKAAEDKSAEGK